MKNEILMTEKGFYIDEGDGTATRYVFDGKYRRVGDPETIPENAVPTTKAMMRIKAKNFELEDDPSDMTVKELKAVLDERGIEYSSRAKKDELQVLLNG